MKTTAEVFEDSSEVAVRLASARLTAMQYEHALRSAKIISETKVPRGQRYSDKIQRAAFIMETAKILDDRNFGLNLARTAEPREFGAIFYVMNASSTVYDAIENLFRYIKLVQFSPAKITGNSAGILIKIETPSELEEVGNHLSEWNTAILISALRHLTRNSADPSLVTFTHPRSTAVDEFKKFFNCDVRFGQPHKVIEIPAQTLALPIDTSDPYLLRVMKAVCDEALANRDSPKHSPLRARVEKVTTELLPHGKATSSNVAKVLALSTRTFARRLADEGTTFSIILDELRRDLALHYVEDQTLEFTQIAWLLGYSEVASFNHAFKRWTSLTPKALRYRKELE